METVTYRMDDREWVCIPEGPLTVPIITLPPNVPQEVKDEWALHNQVAHQVLDAIERKTPVTLRELRGVFGQFKARNERTGHVIVSTHLKHAPVS